MELGLFGGNCRTFEMAQQPTTSFLLSRTAQLIKSRMPSSCQAEGSCDLHLQCEMLLNSNPKLQQKNGIASSTVHIVKVELGAVFLA
jgi:hypothetical protein